MPAPSNPGALRLRLTLAGIAALAGFFLQFSGIADSMDLQFANWLFRNVGTRFEPDPRIAILAVDDASLRLMEPVAGRWPWPRRHLARLVDSCRGAASVSLDILLPEADRGDGDDAILARAIRNNGKVALGGAFVDDLTETPHGAPAASLRMLPEVPPHKRGGPYYLLDQFLMPTPALARACRTIGHANFFPSRDHLLRAYPYTIASEGGEVPSLALAALQAAGENLVDVPATTWLPPSSELVFYNRPFHRISAADLLFRPQTPEGRFDWARDRHVFIGVVAAGAHEWRATPVSPNFTGVEVHATALANWLAGIRMCFLPSWLVIAMVLAAAILPFLRWQASLREWAAVVVLSIVGTIALFTGLFWAVPLRPSLTAPLAAGLTACACRVFDAALEERRRRRMLEELQQMKRMLANMLLHDLNAPLSGMIMLLESVLPSQPAETQPGRRIRNAIEEARRLSGILRNLLDIERMESARMQVNATPILWANMVADIVDRLAPLARGRGVAIEVNIPPDLRWEADSSMMERVLINLLDNAIRHATPVSVVQVTATIAEGSSPGFIGRVINRGEAIPAPLLASIFEPFRTGALTPGGNSVRGRFGLGLAYCRLAMAAHGGNMTCTSPAPGFEEGACFEFTLPAQSPKPAADGSQS